MPETARWIGAIIRWAAKGFRTKLKHEIEGSLDPTWGATYDTENFIIGISFIIIILGLTIWCLF